MRNLLTFASLLFLLAVVWGTWAKIRPIAAQAPGQAGQAAQAQPLLTFEPSTVTRLAVRRGQVAFSIKRGEGQGWLVQTPFQARADAYLAERALLVLHKIPAEPFIQPEGASLSQYGLGPDDPRTRIVLEDQGTSHWIELGRGSPNGKMIYARSSERDGIVLVPKDRLQALPQEAADLLDRRIFPIALDPLRTIEVARDGARLALQAGGTGWMLTAPIRTRADTQVMTEWLKRLAALTAAAVHLPDPGAARRASRTRLGSIRMAAGQTGLTADLFRRGDVILVRRSDQPDLEFELPAAQLPLLFPDTFALRDKHLVHGAGPISAVEFRNRGRVLSWIRTPQGWTRAGIAPTATLSEQQAERLERWLTDLRLAAGSAPVPTLLRCRPQESFRWVVTLRGPGRQLVGRVALARTRSCGDVATLPTGEWVRLPQPDLLDEIPAGRG